MGKLGQEEEVFARRAENNCESCVEEQGGLC